MGVVLATRVQSAQGVRAVDAPERMAAAGADLPPSAREPVRAPMGEPLLEPPRATNVSVTGTDSSAAAQFAIASDNPGKAKPGGASKRAVPGERLARPARSGAASAPPEDIPDRVLDRRK
jgi:hypothetical protein